MKISEEHKEYLNRKHRGGMNNAKGNTYETIYATKEIVRLFASGADIYSTFVGTQLDGVFVDDFHIDENGEKTYIQLKDKKNLIWGSLDKGNLMYDFYWQSAYAQAMEEKFKLKIVYSQENCSIHTGEIPHEIANVTIKELFPSFQNLTMLLQDSEELRKDIQSIMNYPGDVFPLDRQLASVEFIRSQFMELAVPDTLISLAEIKDAYERKHPEWPNFRNSPSVFIPNEMIDILQAFEGLIFTVSGNILGWQYKRMAGNTVLTPELIANICETKPEEIFELITLLN